MSNSKFSSIPIKTVKTWPWSSWKFTPWRLLRLKRGLTPRTHGSHTTQLKCKSAWFFGLKAWPQHIATTQKFTSKYKNRCQWTNSRRLSNLNSTLKVLWSWREHPWCKTRQLRSWQIRQKNYKRVWMNSEWMREWSCTWRMEQRSISSQPARIYNWIRQESRQWQSGK